jgi:hypothetical protein
VIFLVGEELKGSGLPDVVWLRPDGAPMQEEGWARDGDPALGVFLLDVPSRSTVVLRRRSRRGGGTGSS